MLTSYVPAQHSAGGWSCANHRRPSLLPHRPLGCDSVTCNPQEANPQTHQWYLITKSEKLVQRKTSLPNSIFSFGNWNWRGNKIDISRKERPCLQDKSWDKTSWAMKKPGYEEAITLTEQDKRADEMWERHLEGWEGRWVQLMGIRMKTQEVGQADSLLGPGWFLVLLLLCQAASIC
jgi:hypothetical protein